MIQLPVRVGCRDGTFTFILSTVEQLAVTVYPFVVIYAGLREDWLLFLDYPRFALEIDVFGFLRASSVLLPILGNYRGLQMISISVLPSPQCSAGHFV